MAKVKAYKLPSGNWRARVTINGTTRSFAAETKSEAERLAAQYKFFQKDICRLNVGEIIERYISGREGVASPSTIKGYRKIQRCYLQDLGRYNVDVLNSEIIQSEVSKWARELSPKTVRNAYGLLIAALKMFAPDKHINVTLPQKKVIEYAIPDDSEVQTLLKLATGDLRKAILLASIGTMRRGEICALEYEDIKQNVVHVHRDMVEGVDKTWIVKDIPKTTASDRYIEFPEKIITEIVGAGGTGRIIQVTPNTITTGFIRLRKKAGIECRFHDLRHYAASIMHAINIPDQYIMSRGGWSSDGTLKRVYRNTLRDKEKEFADKTNNYLDKLLETEGGQ